MMTFAEFVVSSWQELFGYHDEVIDNWMSLEHLVCEDSL